MSKLKDFYNQPFHVLDELKPTFFGHVFNPFLKFQLNRRLAFVFAICLGLVPWMLFGFDSCIGQPITLLYRLPEFLLGKIDWNTLFQETWVVNYGKEFHYSAILIYGLMYWGLSRHFEMNFGIVKSKNVAYSCALTFLSIGLFEFYWMLSYAHFQQQPWVITLRLPQLRIILQNIMFLLVCSMGVLYMWLDSYILNSAGDVVGKRYHLRFDKITLLLASLSIVTALIWWYYPGYVEQISVQLENGVVWQNSSHFPQTLYTINLNPSGDVNAGVWFFVENNLVHGLNTLVKAFWTLTIFYIGWIKHH